MNPLIFILIIIAGLYYGFFKDRHKHKWINPLDPPHPYNRYCVECGKRQHSYSYQYCGQGDYWDYASWHNGFYKVNEREFLDWLRSYHSSLGR